MDWNSIINYALKLIAMIICGLISAYVIPWLKAKQKELKAAAEAQNLGILLAAIDKFVASAEQLAINEGYDCEWKKNKVIELVEETFGVDVDDEMDAYIESAVIMLHNTLYGNVEGAIQE